MFDTIIFTFSVLALKSNTTIWIFSGIYVDEENKPVDKPDIYI